MPINFIPNDPKASGGPPRRSLTPHRDRPAGAAGFLWVDHRRAARYEPGTPDFLFWQSREAALRAVSTFETINGARVGKWARSPDPKRLEVTPNGGNDLNAYYDGRGLRFFEYATGAKTTFSGASTDVVAHEAGHALLDQLRPSLWDSSFIEVGAFHESFGDCSALLTAFADAPSRTRARARLRRANFLEAVAEDLSDGVRRALGPNHPAAEPRHARNTFRWALPSTLPASGPPPVLTGEVHSFSRVFTGCFYDLVLNILRAKIGTAVPTSARLWQTVRTAGQLLIGAAHDAPETARFFQSVGRTMVLVDQQLFGGANREAIHDAFDGHGIALGSAAMLAPVAALAGRANGRRGVPTVAVTDLRERLGARPGAPIAIAETRVAGQPLLHAVHHREVTLGHLDRRLRGVVARVREATLLSTQRGAVTILGGVPQAATTADEAGAFVRSLLAADRIAFEPAEVRAGIRAAREIDRRKRLPTHAIRMIGGRRVLERVRFACGGWDAEG
jgi:hypothetical protein